MNELLLVGRHQYRHADDLPAGDHAEEPDGFTAHLSVTLPESCGPDVVEHHLPHFAVEFRT